MGSESRRLKNYKYYSKRDTFQFYQKRLLGLDRWISFRKFPIQVECIDNYLYVPLSEYWDR
jgi:hypothetical protein